MGFQCGIVGLPGCGKTTVYNAITAAGATGYGAQEANRAVVAVPDDRIRPLVDMYKAPKEVPATVEMVDIPGLKKGSTAGDGRGSKLLAHVKDVEALLHVVRCFDDKNIPFEYDTINPVRDVETIDLELVVADAQTVQNKIDRLGKKARTGDKDAKREIEHCEKIKAALDEGIPARKQGLSDAEIVTITECNLVSLKPQMYVGNIKSQSEKDNEHVKALAKYAEEAGAEMIVICGRDEADISQLEDEDKAMFMEELGLTETSRERLIRAAYKTLGLIDFITAGETEVHIWTIRKGTRAQDAAGKIHTDLMEGFIRMEVITYDDLMEYGSEAAVAKAGKHRLEGKDYIVQDGDIVVVRHNK
ncbi:MAG: redox-regulated ATPase YchF [Planctomycetes bacterium]|nr:redox-regulated ATPase YchF [Planctomycetota bacterium]